MNRLMALFGANRGAGAFKAEAKGDHAVIYLYDMIVGSEVDAEFWGGVSPEGFVRLLSEVSAETIELRVNCPGGDVFGGRAMAAALKAHPAKITAIVDGYAASAASYLVQACDRVEMGEGSMMMIHNAWIIALGNADDLIDVAGRLRKIDGTIVETYQAAAARRGVEDVDFPALMAAETWFTGAEAVAAGLADTAEVKASASALATVAWDLRAYAKAPEAAAQEPAPIEEEPAAVEAVADDGIAHRRRKARAMLLRAD